MKKNLLLFALVVFSCLKGISQATSLTVDCQTPGWLSSLINYGDQQTLKDLTITGYVNSTDLLFIGTLMKTHALIRLDLEQTNLVSSNGDLDGVLPNDMFSINYPYECHMEKVVLPLSVSEAKGCFNVRLSIDTLVAGGPAMKELNTSFYGTIYQADGIRFNKSVKHLVLREGIETIDRCTFYNGGNYQAYPADCIFESIIFPSSLISIKELAFQGCSALKKANLTENIEEIGEWAFAGLNLYSDNDTIILPNKLKRFHLNSFSKECKAWTTSGDVAPCECYGNQHFYIPESVEVIDCSYIRLFGAYEKCFLHIANDNPPTLSGAYNGTYQYLTVYVPKKSVEIYKNNPIWQKTTILAEPNPATNITIQEESIEMVKGTTRQLYATVLPDDADDLDYTWSSTNSNVVSVSSDGLLTAISSGEAKVFATLNANKEIFDYCLVKVYQPVETVTLEKHSLDMKVGETQSLYAQVLPATADNKKLKWSSSDEKIATVNTEGKVTAKKGGTATITVVSEDNPEAKDQCLVTVTQPVTGITLSQETINMSSIGESVQLEATVLPSDASNKEVKWTSSNEAVCFVSNGKVVATGFGVAVVIATTVDGGFAATCTVTVAAQKFKLTYIVDGDVYKTYEIEVGAAITPEPAPTKEGYTFSGWSEIPKTMPAEDVTITGTFAINQYTITYKIDGEVYQTEKVDYNSKITPPTPPEKEGFDFAWGEYPETMPAHDITITGTYTTGIVSIKMESGRAKVFTLDGKQVEQPKKGVNIVRMGNGVVKKIVIK